MRRLDRIWDSVERFYRRPLSQKLLVIEALVCLFLARMAILCLSFKSVVNWSGVQGQEMSTQEVPFDTLREIRWAIDTASRYGFWNCKCLTQALAAKSMLRRRDLPSTMYLGVTTPGKADFSAHAWLRCGPIILTGGEGRHQFHVVAKFTEEPSD